MRGDKLKTNVLSVQYIPNADPALLKSLRVLKGYNSLGILTTDCDDVSYAALDEATKKAQVRVVYAKSMYAGAGSASGKLSGEFIGILAGPDPEEVRSGIQAAVSYIENDAFSTAPTRMTPSAILPTASPAPAAICPTSARSCRGSPSPT